MAVTRTGSVTRIDSNANSGSQSITVPSDAELMMVGVTGVPSDVSADYFSATPPTIGGASTTLIDDRDGTVNGIGACVFYKTSPATGSQTFAWDWKASLTPLIGNSIFIAFYKGVNTSSPMGAHGGAQTATNTANTGSLTASSGDALFAVCGAYDPTSVTWTNATELADAKYNGLCGSCAEAFPSGNVTVTATHSGGSAIGTGISAAVISQAAGGTTYDQSVSGGITPSGALARVISKSFAGGFTPTGATNRQTAKSFTGGATPTGSLSRQISKIVSGALSSISGTLTTIRLFVISLSGDITPSGTVTKQTSKSADGSVTPTGTISRQVNKVVSGALSSITGSLNKITSKVFAGSITPSGVLTQIRTFLVSVGGALTLSGVLSRLTSKTVSGSVAPSGAMSRSVAKSLSGSLTPSGSIIKQIAKSIGGVISSIVGALESILSGSSTEGEAALSDYTIYGAGLSDYTNNAASIGDAEST